MNPEIDWHARFTSQASWTLPLRQYLYKKVKLDQVNAILEVGCGTGAIISELPGYTSASVFGLDLDLSRLLQTRSNVPYAHLSQADALHLPFPQAVFNVILCHFLLLWVRDPLQVLIEMRRVTRPGGYILIMAEPDYSHRQDHPQSLARLGRLQIKSLRRQGANPSIALQLPGLFARADLKIIDQGILTRDPSLDSDLAHWKQEWAVLESDLARLIPKQELLAGQQEDNIALTRGEHTSNIPIHYALCQV